MAGNANSVLSTTMSPAGAVSADLPVARVSRDPAGFKVQFGDDEIIGAPGDDLPFPVENAKQKSPMFKKYGALFGCDGGKLTIGETTYRIQVVQQQQQANEPLQPAIAMAMAERVQENLRKSVCLFVDEDEKEPLGCGFAVSAGRVYTCAHHWQNENRSMGTEVKCYYGKAENKKLYTMNIIKIDGRLDYCVLERNGDAPFPDFLRILDKSEGVPDTTQVFLVAFQIGLKKDLQDFNVEKGLGFSPGHIIKKGKRHFLHSCPAFKGDSGGAIVICGGQVVGIHLAAVNDIQKTLDMNSLELESVADSVEDLIHSHHSGCVALFPSSIKPE